MLLNEILIVIALGIWMIWGLLVILLWRTFKKKEQTPFEEIDEFDKVQRMHKLFKETYDQDIDNHKRNINWEDFTPALDTIPGQEAKDWMNEQAQPKRKEDGKYNPDDINGKLDDFFKDTK